MIVVGVDPGKTTGVVVRHLDDLLHAELVAFDGGSFRVFLKEVVSAVGDAEMRAIGAWSCTVPDPRPPRIAVEDLVHPNPHLGLANLDGLLLTAQVLGAIRAQFDVTLVPPAGHGSAPLSTYPPGLVGAREHGLYGTGKRRHVRSAWDIAGAVESPLACL